MQDMTARTIGSGYETWIDEATRAASNELDLGAWWHSNGTYWHVAWIEATGELYAAELGGTDRFVIIGRFEKKDMLQLMRQWHNGNDLGGLIQRLTQQPFAE